MKRISKIIVSSVTVFLIVLLWIFSLQSYLIKRETCDKSWDFYNNSNPDEYSVLIMGSSHIVMCLSPMEMWNDYGFTSYNMANFAQFSPQDYWILKDALTRIKPELVILDAYGLSLDDKIELENSSNFHRNIDAMPLSKVKYDCIKDLLPQEKQSEFIFPLAYMHSWWKDEEHFNKSDDMYTFKGEELDVRSSGDGVLVEPISSPKNVDFTNRNDSETLAKEYLDKCINLCRERGIEVLLLNTPSNYGNERQQWINSAQTYAEKYGINFLDCNKVDNLVNYATDFRDIGHVNTSGARKVSKYVGEYIVSNYNLHTDYSTELITRWNESYNYYSEFSEKQLMSQEEMDKYLMLVSNCKNNVILDITSHDCFKEEVYRELLKNLGADMNDNIRFVIIEKGGEHTTLINKDEDMKDTRLGLFEIRSGEEDDIRYHVLLGGKELYSIDKYQDNNKGIRCSILDSNNLLIDQKMFLYNIQSETEDIIAKE